MAGLIGYASSGQARYVEFFDDLRYLRLAEPAFWSHHDGPYIPINRNALCQEAIDNDAEWLLMIDDDHRFSPDLLERLLAHKDADVVVPLVLRRQAPYTSLIYVQSKLQGFWRVVPLDRLPTSGTQVVDAAATSCMLIHRHVLDAIPKPWFEMGRRADDGLTGEDLEWSKKLLEHGFKILLDADTRIGHISQVTIWPGDGDVRMELGPGIEITLQPEVTLS